MKILKGILLIFTVSLMATSCSDDDNDDTNLPGSGSTFFMWDINGITYDAFSTSTYDGVGLRIFTEDRQDATIKLDIRCSVDGAGLIELNTDVLGAGDGGSVDFKFGGAEYTTTATSVVELEITSLDEQKKEMNGTFQGEVVNRNDMNDVLVIEKGSFLITWL